jgi:hypothetical protein
MICASSTPFPRAIGAVADDYPEIGMRALVAPMIADRPLSEAMLVWWIGSPLHYCCKFVKRISDPAVELSKKKVPPRR